MPPAELGIHLSKAVVVVTYVQKTVFLHVLTCSGTASSFFHRTAVKVVFFLFIWAFFN
jgi:hypothetical protein